MKGILPFVLHSIFIQFLNGDINNIVILKKNSIYYRLVAIRILEMWCSAVLIQYSPSK